MNIADFVVLGIVAAVVIIAVMKIIRNKKNGKCNCGCSMCSQSDCENRNRNNQDL